MKGSRTGPLRIFLTVASVCFVMLLEEVNCFIPQADLPKGCISEARVFGGNMAKPNGPVEGVETLEDCIEMCKGTDGCSSISYNIHGNCKRKPEDLNLFNREDNVKWVTCHKDAGDDHMAGDGCEPDPCNGVGECLEGQCFCFEGYIGDNCEQEVEQEPAPAPAAAPAPEPAPAPAPTEEHSACKPTFVLESPWTSGKALFCNDLKSHFISCTTESGGLAACKQLCENNLGCTTINFIPDGADGISGPNRCCLQGCSETDFTMDSKHKGWDVYRITRPGVKTWALESPWTTGKALFCNDLKSDFISCTTESGGLAACKQLCEENSRCTTINFIPEGADGTSGLNRCCLQGCSETDFAMSSRDKGWDVYRLSSPTCEPGCELKFTLESPWTTGKALFCNNLKADFISCTTESGGLAACKKLCEENTKCTTISFIPEGADGTSGLNRCCLQGCSETDFVMSSRDKGWDVYRITRPDCNLWTLESPWTTGMALFCNNLKADFISCTTESGGLAACKQLCEENAKCTTISFIPEGADGTSGLNRCCLQGCSETDFAMSSRDKGWDVYRITRPE